MKLTRVLLAAIACLSLTPAAIAQVPSLDARVSLNIVEQDLAQVVQFLRDRSGANIVIVEGGENKVRDLQISDVYWRDALEYAVELASCVVDEDKSGVLKISNPPRVGFDFRDQDINEIITAIATASGANIIVSPDVSGTVRVKINDVPWRDALEEIVKTRGYTVVEERRGILRVVDPLSLEQQQVTRSYQLRFLRPRSARVPTIKSEFHEGGTKPPTGSLSDNFTVLTALSKALSPSGELDFIVEQNVIIIRDTTQVHEAVQEIIRRLDVEPPQIFVDVKFVSTINTDFLDLGVDYGDAGPQISFSGGSIPIELPFQLGDGGWEDHIIANDTGAGPFATAALNPGTTTIPNVIFGSIDFTQWAATIKMLQRDTKSEVIQAPKLITMDGNEATIFVGETVRYAEAKSEQGQAGGLQLTVAEASGSPVEIGFQLMVRPHVVPGTKKIIMEVIPKETSLSGSSVATALSPAGFDIFTVGAAGVAGTIALPRTRASTVFTQMMVESGQTAVIGGLTTEIETTTVSRVPYISRIPILGQLFKHRAETKDLRSLVIFITPTMVHSSEDVEFLLQQELTRRGMRLKEELEHLLNPQFGSDS